MNFLIPVIVVGGYLAYKAVSTQRTADALDIKVTGLNDLVITLWETKFKLTLNAGNPTSKPLTINEIHLNLLWGDSQIGSVNLYGENVTLPAKQQTTLTLPVSLSNTGVVSSLIKAIENGQGVTIRVKGYVMASGFRSDVDDEVRVF